MNLFEFEEQIQDKEAILPRSGDRIENALAKKLGVFIEESRKKDAYTLKFVFGSFRIRENADYVIWKALVDAHREIERLTCENDASGRVALQRERSRVKKLLNRASQELRVHSDTLMLAAEISGNFDAEKVIFGGPPVDNYGVRL
jgi:hypothetical protein